MLRPKRLRLLTAWHSRSVTHEGDAAGGLGQDEEELVAAIAAEVVAPAEMGGDGFGDIAEGCIAGCVALNVIDGFEVVDVDEGDGESMFAALDVLEFGGEFDLDAAAVEGAGERSFCDSSALRAMSSLLERTRMKRPVTKEDMTPVRRVALPTALL